MNFLVISDSHRRPENISEAVKRCGMLDAILYLGDGMEDFDDHTSYRGIPLFCVKGNATATEMASSLPEELILNFDEYTVMMMHGHLYETSPCYFEKAAAHAAKSGADVLLFGHTHYPIEKYLPEGTVICGEALKKPLYVFNPGCLGRIAHDLGAFYFGTMRTTRSPRGIIFSHAKI